LVRPVIGHRVLARAARPDSANSAPVPVYPAHKPPSRLGTADSSGRHTSGHTTNLSHQRRGSPTRTGEVAKKNSAYRVIPTRGQRLWSVGECDGPGTGSRGLSQDHIHAAEIRRRDAVMLKDRLVRPETDRADPVTVVAADAGPLARIGLRTLVERGADLRWVGYIEESRSVLLTVARLRPQVLLLDSSWDQDSTLVQALNTHFPELNVKVLTRPRHQRVDEPPRKARNAGAVAELPRDERPADLLARIQRAVSETIVPQARAG